MVRPVGPLQPQRPHYSPGLVRPWWFRPDRAISHAAWFRAMAEVEACSPDRGGSPAPTVWTAYVRQVEIAVLGRPRPPTEAYRTLEASFIGRDDAGRFTRTQDPA